MLAFSVSYRKEKIRAKRVHANQKRMKENGTRQKQDKRQRQKNKDTKIYRV